MTALRARAVILGSDAAVVGIGAMVAIGAQVAIGALLAIGAVVALGAEGDTDGHCKYMQIR